MNKLTDAPSCLAQRWRRSWRAPKVEIVNSMLRGTPDGSNGSF
jgi:hypothetical protein